MSVRTTGFEVKTLMLVLVIGLVMITLAGCTSASARASSDEPAPFVTATSQAAAGEYLTIVGGCNDCHTPGWNESFGQVPSENRLTGVELGFRGPWGTSYPANLRLSVQGKSNTEWITMIRGRRGMPPMPWMNLHLMNQRDLEAIYAYLVSLGPKGEPAPAYVPPDREPATPYVVLEPVMPKGKS
jgi:mono/diheme cytochrome c family protein